MWEYNINVEKLYRWSEMIYIIVREITINKCWEYDINVEKLTNNINVVTNNTNV